MARPWMRRIRSANGECESTQRAELEVGQDSRAPTRDASFSPPPCRLNVSSHQPPSTKTRVIIVLTVKNTLGNC